MQFQEERFLDLFLDEDQPLASLLVMDWGEVEEPGLPLEPDWDLYTILDRRERLSITTARDDEGVLVGYAAYLLSHSLHHKSVLFATGDLVWLHPDYRKGTFGWRLYRAAEGILKARGASRIVNTVKADRDLAPLMDRMGYKVFEKSYYKDVS